MFMHISNVASIVEILVLFWTSFNLNYTLQTCFKICTVKLGFF